jgi:hypothetical protein
MGFNYVQCAVHHIQHHLEHIFLRGNISFDLHDPLTYPNHEGTYGVFEDQSVLSHRQNNARSSNN